MNPIQDKHIILGVTGSIACYKAADLASKLTQAGALVDVILTESAARFVQPITFQSVTGRKANVDKDLWNDQGHVTHIGLGHAADLVVVAPITANTMAKLAHGIADNLLSVTALAADCPLIIAPAMDGGMYTHAATQDNLKILQKRGTIIVGPEVGRFASAMVGLGRMSEPLKILGEIRRVLAQGGPLSGKKVVVTAGGTQEPLDPVRYLTNRSSGKQGYALAQAAVDLGASVTLISAPANLTPPAGAELVPVRTAIEMLDGVLAHTADADLLLMAAAVADFKPESEAEEKIKKAEETPALRLTRTADILLEVGKRKVETGFPRITVGFAAESENLLSNAAKKLTAKSLDMIAANDISATDAGFGVDTNRITLLFPDGSQQSLELMSKAGVAEAILEKCVELIIKETDMDPRIHIITLGVADIALSYDFYHKGLGFPTSGTPESGIIFFQTGGVCLALYPADELAEDVSPNFPAERSRFPGITLAHNTQVQADVDKILARAVEAGGKLEKPAADTFWGGYSGYFSDPDGYLWEVAYANSWDFHPDGSLVID